MIGAVVLSEAISYLAFHDPNAVGLIAIFLFIALIIYFAFRTGLRGGFIAVAITIFYYLYIIDSRDYTGAQFITSIQTTAVLGVLYVLLAWIIGWLKQTIDLLIEQEANEKRKLQAIVQQLPVGVIVADNNGTIIHGNQQLEKILGRKIREGLVAGRDIIAKGTHNGKEVGPSGWPLAHTLTTGKPVIDKEFKIQNDKGKDVVLQISASPIKSRSGKVIAAAAIINDITQQKELETRKDDFVNMASHELKTPITSMKLYIDSLSISLGKYNDERATKIMHNLKGQTDKLQKLVNDLLDVSRLQTGKLGFEKEDFRLDTLISEIIEVLQDSTKKHTIVYAKKAAVKVYADKFRIYQVITNLVTNAIKYSPQESSITINLVRKQGKAVVSVTDSGIGIAKDQQKRIFERLYQVADMKEKTYPGFGMGLFISKEIIRRHKGTIWVESEKGKGSTFYFSLPLNT